MSMCKSIENVCDYDAYVFRSLPLVGFFFFFFFFACLLLLFLLLIWHHERGLGLLTGITYSGALFCFVFLSLLFINIMASVAPLYIYA